MWKTNLSIETGLKIYICYIKMSISYSGLTTQAKVTLPSVQYWGNNANIMKDPPRSIMTRKKDRVGSNNRILDEAGNAGSRISDTISVYQRGVNPHVEVDFGNSSRQGGQSRGVFNGQGSQNTSGQSFLPHRVLNNGAFRPPTHMFEQRNVLPLSRLPRRSVHVSTNPESIYYFNLENPEYVKAASNPKMNIPYQTNKLTYSKNGYTNSDYMFNKNVPSHSVTTNPKKPVREGFTRIDRVLSRNTPGHSYETNKVDKRVDMSNTMNARTFDRVRERRQFESFGNQGQLSKIIREVPSSINTSLKNDMSLKTKASEAYNSYIFKK